MNIRFSVPSPFLLCFPTQNIQFVILQWSSGRCWSVKYPSRVCAPSDWMSVSWTWMCWCKILGCCVLKRLTVKYLTTWCVFLANMQCLPYQSMPTTHYLCSLSIGVISLKLMMCLMCWTKGSQSCTWNKTPKKWRNKYGKHTWPVWQNGVASQQERIMSYCLLGWLVYFLWYILAVQLYLPFYINWLSSTRVQTHSQLTVIAPIWSLGGLLMIFLCYDEGWWAMLDCVSGDCIRCVITPVQLQEWQFVRCWVLVNGGWELLYEW